MTPKVLMRDDDGKPIAASCKDCGKFTLNTETFLCVACMMGQHLEQFKRESNERVVTAAADAWLREGRY